MIHYLLLFIFSASAFAITQGLDFNVELADTPKNNYKYKVLSKLDSKLYKTEIDTKSIDWIRYKEVLVTPRIRLTFTSYADKQISLNYNNKTYLLQKFNEQFFSTLSVFPFLDDKIKVYANGDLLGELTIKVNNNNTPTVIDHSCAKAQISIDNKNVPLVLGCLIQESGDFFAGEQNVSALFMSANYKIKQNSEPVYTYAIKRRANIQLLLNNYIEDKKTIQANIKYRKRAHRLGLAMGLGPYQFNSSFMENELDPTIAPAFMLYGNFKIKNDISIRGFDALITKQSTFNNAGLYLANDIAKTMDRKLTVTTLLGVQYLNFKFDDGFKSFNKPIYPQGLEATYRHAFDIKNYVISGGIFVSPTKDTDYSNMWIRWGKGYYWELNYIRWAQEDYDVSMWGLSVIFPLGQFF